MLLKSIAKHITLSTEHHTWCRRSDFHHPPTFICLITIYKHSGVKLSALLSVETTSSPKSWLNCCSSCPQFYRLPSFVKSLGVEPLSLYPSSSERMSYMFVILVCSFFFSTCITFNFLNFSPKLTHIGFILCCKVLYVLKTVSCLHP